MNVFSAAYSTYISAALPRVIALLPVVVFTAFPVRTLAAPIDDATAWMGATPESLRVMVELASDVPADAATVAERDKTLQALYAEIEKVDAERAFAWEAFAAAPDSEYAQVVAVGSERPRPVDYLGAMRESYGRYKAAEAAGDRAALSRHMVAGRKYAGLAAEGLKPAAQAAQDDADQLKSKPYAIRRPEPAAAAFLENLKTHGLSAEHRKVLAAGGLSEKEVTDYQAAVQGAPAGEVGISIVELYDLIAEYRRLLAKDLSAFAGGDLTLYAEPRSLSFVVGNPHDRDEVVDLTIRRISIPADWKLSIVNAPLPEPSTLQAAGQKKPDPPQVSEVRPGQLYRVTLPAKTEVRVVSVVVPDEQVGENTTARWAVEGRIGNELLGGIVHEMHVPAVLAELQLLPVGAVATPDAGSVAEAPRFGSRLVWLAAAVSVLLVGIFLVAWRRKRTS